MAVDFTRAFGLTPPFIGDLSPLCLIDASDLAKPVARRCTALLRGIKPSFTDRNRLSMRVIEPNWTSIYVRSSCVVRPATLIHHREPGKLLATRDYYRINDTMTQLDDVPAEFRRLGIESYALTRHLHLWLHGGFVIHLM